MKKEHWLITIAAGVGVAAVIYSLLSKDSIPKGALTVQPFNKFRYLGKWNEIARLPNRIEKDIKYLTENYSLNEDGSIRVVTKGYNIKTNEWKDASGRIKFADDENEGKLKVSYFGPFYTGYNVLDIDPDYKHALVSGSGLDYLWILSKENDVPENLKERFLTKAKNIGFAIDKLEWV